MSKQPTCAERVQAEYQHEMDKIRKLWRLYQSDPDLSDEDYGNWNDYGLSFDYVPAGTFNDQEFGYWRYQISWGGPSLTDEFRFYADTDLKPYRIEYWFMDWFDGASVLVEGEDLALWKEIWADWVEMELPQIKRQEAID